jgi:hypothetical protein
MKKNESIIMFVIIIVFVISHNVNSSNSFLTSNTVEDNNSGLNSLNNLEKLKELFGLTTSKKSNIQENNKTEELKEKLLQMNLFGGDDLEVKTKISSPNKSSDNDLVSFLQKKEFKKTNMDEETRNEIDQLRSSVKTLVEQMRRVNDNITTLNNISYDIKNVEVEMPEKGKESKFKHGLDINNIFNVAVSLVNGSENNKILKSQVNLASNRVLFNWYLDNDYFYLIHPNNLDVKDKVFVEGSKVRISLILKKS